MVWTIEVLMEPLAMSTKIISRSHLKLYEKKVLSVHDRYQPFRRLPNMKSVRLNAVFRKVEMSEKLKSNFALFIFV